MKLLYTPILSDLASYLGCMFSDSLVYTDVSVTLGDKKGNLVKRIVKEREGDEEINMNLTSVC